MSEPDPFALLSAFLLFEAPFEEFDLRRLITNHVLLLTTLKVCLIPTAAAQPESRR